MGRTLVGLPTGDYALAEPGLEKVVCIERKSINDLANTLIHGMDRWWREVERMKEYGYAAIVVEATLRDIYAGTYHSRANGSSVVGLCNRIMKSHGIPVLLAGRAGDEATRMFAARWVQQTLKMCYKDAHVKCPECGKLQRIGLPAELGAAGLICLDCGAFLKPKPAKG